MTRIHEVAPTSAYTEDVQLANRLSFLPTGTSLKSTAIIQTQWDESAESGFHRKIIWFVAYHTPEHGQLHSIRGAKWTWFNVREIL